MKLVVAVLGLALAAPAVAQMPPPPPGEMTPGGPDRMHGHNPMFAGMSEAGKAIMQNAMRGRRSARRSRRDRCRA